MYIIYNYMPTYLHKKYTKTIPINLYYQKDKQFLAGKKSWNFSLTHSQQSTDSFLVKI